MYLGGRNDSKVRFRDNQGPHPPLQYVKAKPPPKHTTEVLAPTISHTHQHSQVRHFLTNTDY